MSDSPREQPTQSLHPDSDVTLTKRPHATERSANDPSRIGPYRVLQTLGEGGMGVVYLAEQEKPIHRRVALKIIKLGMDTKQVIARFEAEREALALMNHPNVAKVFDAGATEQGRPYFVMEHVAGISITDYCDRHRLTTEERLDLFSQVCQAIQHAHQKGIIHRDIKPSNVLITVQDDRPVPKVIDFGVAKAIQHRLTERTFFTEQGQMIGTPGYMSPEQADMTALDIDTRTDVYSLGVILYELLVGALPFETKTLLQRGLAEVQRIIRDVEPPKPSTRLSGLGPDSTIIAQRRRTEPQKLVRQVRGDLDWIVMKCLEKDRTRRYDTANGLALDIQRFLSNEPVLAGPPRAGYRLKKFVRRNRASVIAVSAVIVALAMGLSIAVRMYKRAEHERLKTELARQEASLERDRAVAAEKESLSRREQAEEVTTFLREMLGSASPYSLAGPDLRMSDVLKTAGERIDSSFSSRPLVAAALHHTIGAAYRDLGFYPAAELHLGASIRLRTGILGPDHPDTLAAMEELTAVMARNHRLAEAELLARANLQRCRQAVGEDHWLTIDYLGGLSFILFEQGKLEQAEPVINEYVSRSLQAFGDDDVRTCWARKQLARLLGAQGRFDDADRMHREVLSVFQRLYGPNHPSTMDSEYDIARLYRAKGDNHKAELYMQDILARWEQSLGSEHPYIHGLIVDLAAMARSDGRIEEAEEGFRKAIGIGEKMCAKGACGPLANSLDALAWTLMIAGKHSEAEELERKTLAIRQNIFGEGHIDVAESMNNLAVILGEQGKYEEALVLHDDAAEMRRALLGNEHALIVESLHNQTRLAQKMGQYHKAESLSREALSIERKLYGDDDFRIVQGLFGLANLLANQEEFDEAISVTQEGSRIARARLGDDHPTTAYSLALLGSLLTRSARGAEAEAVLQDCLSIRQRTLPASHWLIANTTSMLGESLIIQGRFAEAEPKVIESLDAILKSAGAPRLNKDDALSRIGKLYELWDAAEPGKGHAEKAAEWRAKLTEVSRPSEGSSP